MNVSGVLNPNPPFRFDLGSSAISRMAVGVTDQYSTREMLDEVLIKSKVFLKSMNANIS